MNAQQFKELHLIYDAVYDDNLREEVEEYNNAVYTEDIVEVATEYFYSYGLNSDGIDILVEKVGLESFVEFVYDLSEDLYVLTEERAAKKRTGGESYAAVKAKIDAKEAAKKKAKEAGAKKKSETSGPESEAKKEQPKSKAPVRDAIARGIFRAVDAYKAGVERHKEATKKAGDAYRKGVEKHNAATSTAGKLAKETGKTVGKAAQVAGHLAKSVGGGVGIAAKAGKKMVGEEVEAWVNQLVEEGYDLSDYTWEEMAEIYLDEANRAEKELGLTSRERTRARNLHQNTDTPIFYKKKNNALKDRSSSTTNTAHRNMAAKRRENASEEVDIYDVILSHLLDEGYADTEQAAEAIMVNMSEEWRDDIVEKTAMAKKGHDETEIRNKIAKNTKGGEFADRATELENRPTFGDGEKKSAREKLARTQRGDFRRTTSSDYGLRLGAHKSDDPAVKEKQSARGKQRSALTPKEKKQLNR
jgi:hypothetical protein